MFIEVFSSPLWQEWSKGLSWAQTKQSAPPPLWYKLRKLLSFGTSKSKCGLITQWTLRCTCGIKLSLSIGKYSKKYCFHKKVFSFGKRVASSLFWHERSKIVCFGMTVRKCYCSAQAKRSAYLGTKYSPLERAKQSALEWAAYSTLFSLACAKWRAFLRTASARV